MERSPVLVRPDRVPSRRWRLPAALWIAAFAGALASALLATTGAPPRAPAALPSTAASAGAPPVVESEDEVTRPRSPVLSVQLALADGPGAPRSMLSVRGWVPSQYGWVTLEATMDGQRLARSGAPVEWDGEFVTELPVGPATLGREVRIDLAGLNDVQLQPVPLLSLRYWLLDRSVVAPGGPGSRTY